MKRIFSDQQLSSIILGLEKGDLPIKYSYMTKKGSQAWSKLESHRTKLGQSFADALLLEQSIELYLQELNNPQELALFDFGCGTGETVKRTLHKLDTLGIKVMYHAFDISESIITLCEENLTDKTHCHFNYSIIDFEISNLVTLIHDIRNSYNNIPVLGLLLGNTVGNFNSMERLLSNIMESLKLGDKLAIGIERADIHNRRRYDTMIKTYNTPEVFDVFRATMAELGFSLEYGTYQAIFNEKQNTIEGFFSITKDLSITIHDTLLHFRTGERIRTGQSKKIDETNFSKLLLDLDLRIANIRTNESNTYLQALVGAKKF